MGNVVTFLWTSISYPIDNIIAAVCKCKCITLVIFLLFGSLYLLAVKKGDSKEVELSELLFLFFPTHIYLQCNFFWSYFYSIQLSIKLFRLTKFPSFLHPVDVNVCHFISILNALRNKWMQTYARSHKHRIADVINLEGRSLFFLGIP